MTEVWKKNYASVLSLFGRNYLAKDTHTILPVVELFINYRLCFQTEFEVITFVTPAYFLG